MGYHGIPTLRDSCGRRTPRFSGTSIHWVWWNLQCFKVRDLEGSPHDHYISRLGVRVTEFSSVGNHSCLKKKTPQMWKFTDLKSRMRRKEKKKKFMSGSSFSNLITISLLYYYISLLLLFLLFLFSETQC